LIFLGARRLEDRIQLKSSTQLELLDLDACPIVDDALAAIVPLTNLRHLNLIGSKITDDSIGTLSKLSQLEYIGIASTQISADGFAKLKRTLAEGCEIE
jgi:Leucine-rich repeat (LRR) protein